MADLTDPVFRQLTEARNGLLRLHKSLLDGQKADFEREHARIASPGELLQLVIHNPQFDWLHRLSELVVEIDEATDANEPLTKESANSLLDQVRRLMAREDDSFGPKLREAVSRSQEVARVHDDVMRIIRVRRDP